MRAISSHRDLRYNKMRVLIVSVAILACATAAPSHGHFVPLSPLAIPAIQTYAVPAAIPTISSGDIQAAAINAQVKAADLAQAAIDKARELNEQVAEDLKAKVSDNVDLNKEQITDVLWATNDKQWQALDQLRTVQAKIDGAVASQADIWAKSAVGVAPYVAGIAPIAPVVYPGYVAPGFKSIASSSLTQTHPETLKFEGAQGNIELAAASAAAGADASAATLKSAEANAAFDAAAITANGAAADAADASAKSAAANIADASAKSAAADAANAAADASAKSAAADAANAAAAAAADAAAAAGAAAAKSAEALAKIETESIQKAEAALAEAKSEVDKAFVALHGTVLTPGVALANGFGYTGVGIAPVPLVQPVLKYDNTVQHYGQVLTPTFVKTAW